MSVWPPKLPPGTTTLLGGAVDAAAAEADQRARETAEQEARRRLAETYARMWAKSKGKAKPDLGAYVEALKESLRPLGKSEWSWLRQRLLGVYVEAALVDKRPTGRPAAHHWEVLSDLCHAHCDRWSEVAKTPAADGMDAKQLRTGVLRFRRKPKR